MITPTWNNFKDYVLFAFLVGLTFGLVIGTFLGEAECAQGALTGKATYYTVKSCKKEGNSGLLTASGQRYDERSMTCALRSRDFGKKYRVTNLKNGKSVVVTHNDYGPGKKPAADGVVIDLSPAAYDALGGTRGVNKKRVAWGEIKVIVEAI